MPSVAALVIHCIVLIFTLRLMILDLRASLSMQVRTQLIEEN